MTKKRPLVLHVVLAGLLCVPLMGCPTGSTDPVVTVLPAAVNFGTSATVMSIAIANNGGGVLTWALAESIPWLTVDRTAGATTTNIDRIFLTVDRTGLAVGAYDGQITITTSAGVRTVYVALTMAGDPGDADLQVSPSTVNLLGEQTSETFAVLNNGTGALTWGLRLLDPDDDISVDRPAWLTFDWAAGGNTLLGGASTTVTVNVDRDTIPEGIYSYRIEISTDLETRIIELNIAEGLSPEIGVDPNVLDFGTTGTVLSFEVFNTGANGSILEFDLATSRPDLIAIGLPGDPPGGVSVGTDDPDTYDRVEVPVTIIRSALTGAIDGGTITVSAPGLESVEVIVNVEAAPLTFEGAQNRTRPPFILRFVFLLRDALGNAIDTSDPATYTGPDAPLQFTVEEDGELLDPDETNTFITGADDLRYNLVLLLDFTGSMYHADPGSGAVIDDMVDASVDFIDTLFNPVPGSPPRAYTMAVMEYHERQQTDRIIHQFSTNPVSLTAGLQTFSLAPADHGASELRDALDDACDRLAEEDFGQLPLDDADVRAIVFVSDGRDTSSVTAQSELIDKAKDLRVRLYPIGFGENVNAVDLVEMATETGGHYYPATDASILTQALGTTIPTDLSQQLVLTYISLFQDGSHTYLIRGDYDGLEGSFQRDGVFALDGDVRAGQLSLRTSGIDPLGTAEVFVRTEYVPRNISQFKIRIISPRPYTLQIDPNGLISDWLLVPDGGDPDVYTALTFETNPLPYGSFGTLFRIAYAGLAPADDFILGFRVDNQVYHNPPNTKFFQYPEGIQVSPESAHAGVLPILVSDGFDPDALYAWDRDEDGTPDFDDLWPDDPNLP
ncbi:MAG: VWA domain-containing protein [bacterium]|nr:VWA domain-containing protein [bacterium]